MFNKIKIQMFTALCSMIAALAYFNVDINCFGIIYEPEIPEVLKK